MTNSQLACFYPESNTTYPERTSQTDVLFHLRGNKRCIDVTRMCRCGPRIGLQENKF